MLPCCHVLCNRDTNPLPSHRLNFKFYKFLCLLWPTASEKKLLQNKTGPGPSQTKHNSWSESLSSAIRLMPGRNTKEMTCKSQVTSALCLFWLCHWSAFYMALQSLSGLGSLLSMSVDMFHCKLDTYCS